VLVIDEISMIGSDFFKKVEHLARIIRKTDKPFGGIQVVRTFQTHSSNFQKREDTLLNQSLLLNFFLSNAKDSMWRLSTIATSHTKRHLRLLFPIRSMEASRAV
jgi:hypothetical protein